MSRQRKIKQLPFCYLEEAIAKKQAPPPKCNCSAPPHMCKIILRGVLFAHEQADDKADVVVLSSYEK
jgi:hypothetical protein